MNEIKEISNSISKLSAEEINAFLAEILTENEISTLSNRWRILKMLNQNFSQRDISSKLNVSLCKITREAKILKNKKAISLRLIKEIENEYNKITR